jgi:hypothetical protein
MTKELMWWGGVIGFFIYIAVCGAGIISNPKRPLSHWDKDDASHH